MSKIKANAFYSALLTGSSLILPFITFPYVTRILAPEGIGQVNFATSFIQYFVIMASLGVPLYGIREIAKAKDNIDLRSKIFFQLFTIKLLCSLLALVIYLILIFSLTKFIDYLPYYLWGLAIIFIGIFDFNYFFYALEDFKYITYRTISFQILSVISIFVFIQTEQDALKYFYIPIFINFFNALVNIKYISRFLNFEAIKSKLLLRKHLKPLFFLFSIVFFSSIYNLLDSTILGFLAENVQVGYYSVASKIIRIPLALIMVLGPIMLPRISMEFKNANFEEIKRIISKSLQFVILIGVPIMVGLYVLAPEIILLVSGKEFSASIDTLRIMSPIPLIIGLTTNFSTQLLVPMGNEKQLLYIVIFGTFCSLLLNFILIPILLQNGAAISFLITETVVLMACYFFTAKYITISIPHKQILVNIFISIPFAGIVLITKHFLSLPISILLLSITVSALYYFIIQLYLIKNSLLIEIKVAVIQKIQSIAKR